MTSEEHPERMNWQDLPPNGDEGIRFDYPLAEDELLSCRNPPLDMLDMNAPTEKAIREFSRWMAEQIAISERVRKESESIIRCSTTHTMIVMHDGEVVYNKHPDKVVPPAIFG